MALTIIKNLETLCPVDNPMVIKIHTNNQYLSLGQTVIRFMIFTVIDTVPGHFVHLTWNNTLFPFVLAGEPAETGLQLHAATPGQPFEEWLKLLRTDFLNNYYVSRDYDVDIIEIQEVKIDQLNVWITNFVFLIRILMTRQ
jgi:hypothetical protein